MHAANDVGLKVRQIIADSLCLDLKDVKEESNLVRDLGAESIDFLDIMFRLEKEFNIKIPQREIELQARAGIKPEEFETDSILQDKGAKRLAALLPEIPAGEIRAGMAMREIPATFNVAVFVNMVRRKVDGGDFVLDTATATNSSSANIN